MPHTTWRTNSVRAGEFCYVLFPKGDGAGMSWTLPQGWTNTYKTNKMTAWYMANYGNGITVPTTGVPGTYNVGSHATYGTLSVSVQSTPTARPVRYMTRATSATIQDYLDRGYDIELAPGRYEIATEITVPSGAKIIGQDSRLVRLGGSASYQNRMFVPSGPMTLKGLIFDGDRTGIAWDQLKHLHHVTPGIGVNITIEDCKTIYGQLNYIDAPGMLIKNCVFNEGDIGACVTNSVVFNNDFLGHTYSSEHHFFMGASSGCLVSSNQFINTNRGIVIQGAANNNVFLDNYFDGIRWGEGNANEVILLEHGTDGLTPPSGNNGIRDNAFIGFSITNCNGAGIELYGGGMHDNIFSFGIIDCDVHSIYLAALGTGVIGKQTFSELNCKGGIFVLGSGTGTTFNDVLFNDRVQCNNNQLFSQTQSTGVNTKYPINLYDGLAQSGNYTFTNCGFMGADHVYQSISNKNFIPDYSWS